MESGAIIKCKRIAQKMRSDIVHLADYTGGNMHWGGAFSCTDILAVLFGEILIEAGKETPWLKKDKVILSKGHASVALYAALAETGYISHDELETFQQNGSRLSEHCVMNEDLGIECSTGSLGTGFSFGVGLALGAKRKGYSYHTYVIVGDGECDEGIVWEAILSAKQFGLDNLTLIIDHNGQQADGNNEDIITLNDLQEKLNAFGWETQKIDGHNYQQLIDAFRVQNTCGKPNAIIAETVKGKGVSFMEGDNSWHHKVLNRELLEQAKKEVAII